MPKFPEPPAAGELAALAPEIHVLRAGTMLWRIYCRAGGHATRWNTLRSYGPARSRFDHHSPPQREQERAILYAAREGPTCLAEFFQDTRVIDRSRDGPCIVAFQLVRDVALFDLSGAWPTRAGASMAINSGPRARARRWSAAIYEAYPRVEGLRYCSAMDANRPAVALYERASSAMPGLPVFHRALVDPLMQGIIGRAAQRFGYLVV